MKKSIAYYLKDLDRLDEVAVEDLQNWVSEVPYSQPLRKLLAEKLDRVDQVSDLSNHLNAAYHSLDLDYDQAWSEEQEIITQGAMEGGDVSPKISDESIDMTSTTEETITDIADTIGIAPEVVTNLEDGGDTVVTEDVLDEDKNWDALTNLEEAPKEPVEKIVYHPLASDEHEELVEDEVQEVEEAVSEALEEVDEQSEEDSDVVVTYKKKDINIVSDIASEDSDLEVEDFDIVLDQEELKKKKKRKKSKKGKSKERKGKKDKTEKDKSKKDKKEKKKSKKKKAKNKKEEEKAKNKKKAKKKTKPEAVKDTEALNDLISSDYKVADSRLTQTDNAVKLGSPSSISNSFKLQDYSGNSDYIKWLMSTKKSKSKPKRKLNDKKQVSKKIVKSKKKKESKAGTIVADMKAAKVKNAKKKKAGSEVPTKVKKQKKSVSKKAVKLISISKKRSAKRSDVKKGMSKKDDTSKIPQSKVKSKKKDSNKRKTKKISNKQMVLRAAQASVKKKDVIISETLADLLAGQGYDKRAIKMYKQLSLIFPEKSSFFAAKIKKLKKK